MSHIEITDMLRKKLESALTALITDIGDIQIGSREQFPYGWRKAAKGRTVWRIVEEAITQNLEKNYAKYGLSFALPSNSEISVYDFRAKFNSAEVFVNIKSAVIGGKKNKDDISKAKKLKAFFEEDIDRQLFIATFLIEFTEAMAVRLQSCSVIPVSWIPDIYVNPSNNGNLQSSKYKNIDLAIRRTNQEFLIEFLKAYDIALEKRRGKNVQS